VLIGADNKRMVEIWNSLTGVTPVKKFTSGAVAARRIFAEVQKALPGSPTPADPDGMPLAAKRSSKVAAAEPPAASRATGRPAKTAEPEARAGSKKEVLLGLISRKNGASLEELMTALGWQKHSVRGFIATLGKTVSIESFRNDSGVRTYKAS
jgi:hypothetical protein